MYYPGSTAPERARIEKEYGDLYDEPPAGTVPIKRPWQRRMALRAHAAKPEPTRRKEAASATHHVCDILSLEVMHAEKGIRPGHVVVAERSRDQILEVSHTIGQIILES